MTVWHFLQLRWLAGYRFLSDAPAYLRLQIEDLGAELDRDVRPALQLSMRFLPGAGAVGTLHGRIFLHSDQRPGYFQHSLIMPDVESQSIQDAEDLFSTAVRRLYGSDRDALVYGLYNLLSTLEDRAGASYARRLFLPAEELWTSHSERPAASVLVEALLGDMPELSSIWNALPPQGETAAAQAPPQVEVEPERPIPAEPSGVDVDSITSDSDFGDDSALPELELDDLPDIDDVLVRTVGSQVEPATRPEEDRAAAVADLTAAHAPALTRANNRFEGARVEPALVDSDLPRRAPEAHPQELLRPTSSASMEGVNGSSPRPRRRAALWSLSAVAVVSAMAALLWFSVHGQVDREHGVVHQTTDGDEPHGGQQVDQSADLTSIAPISQEQQGVLSSAATSGAEDGSSPAQDEVASIEPAVATSKASYIGTNSQSGRPVPRQPGSAPSTARLENRSRSRFFASRSILFSARVADGTCGAVELIWGYGDEPSQARRASTSWQGEGADWSCVLPVEGREGVIKDGQVVCDPNGYDRKRAIDQGILYRWMCCARPGGGGGASCTSVDGSSAPSGQPYALEATLE